MGRSPLDTAFGSASTQEKRSKKGIAYVALLGVAGLASASSVFAANVSVNSNAAISYTQGTTTIAACDTAIQAALGATFASTAFALDTITLSGIAAACDGKDLVVTLYDGTDKQVIITKDDVDLAGTGDAMTFVIGTAGTALAEVSGEVEYQTISSTAQTAALLAANADRITIEIN
jgi:hypothetical protein